LSRFEFENHTVFSLNQQSVLHSFLSIKEVFLRAEHGRRQKEARKGRGLLMCVSTSTRIVKTSQLTSPTIVVLYCADRPLVAMPFRFRTLLV